MSTTTTNFGWTVPSDTDLVKDGAAAIRTALGGVDTSFVDLKGGTTGQVLAKASGTDLDFSWVAQDDSNAIQNAIVDAKGDLIAATAADTPARLAVGTNGQVLTADSTASTGLAWTTPAGNTFAGVLCKKGTTQTISNTTDTVLNWVDPDHYDTDGFHDPSTNSSRITIPAGLGGYYLVYGQNTWDVNATGRRFCELKKNGTKLFTSNGFAANSSAAPANMISIILNLSAGDYVEYQVWQSSGGNLDTFGDTALAWFGVTKL